MLAALNIIGIRESATVALVMACASFVINLVVIGAAGAATLNMNPSEWDAVLSHLDTIFSFMIF